MGVGAANLKTRRWAACMNCKGLADLVRTNAQMAHKLDWVTVGSASSPGGTGSIAGSKNTTRNMLSFSSARKNFAITVNNSRLLRRALFEHIHEHQGHDRTPFIRGEWAYDVIELLHAHRADIKAKDKLRIPVLHLASPGGHKDVVEPLLNHGADIKATNGLVMTALRDRRVMDVPIRPYGGCRLVGG
ncbi:hypothetical protein DFP73DRAFT_598226 [Morchella snyderi]|nr:hypothetical protein DFP73DRAFT_598226 [Morchella snyderi]